MPRVTRAVQEAVEYPTLQPAAGSLDIVWSACDATNKEQTTMLSGPFSLRFFNSGATPRTITINSVADPQRRTGDITAYTLEAGEFCEVKFKSTIGWKQADGMLYYEASHAEVKCAAVLLS